MDLDANLDPNPQHRHVLVTYTQQVLSTYQDQSLVLDRLRQAYRLGRKQGRIDAISTIQSPKSI